MKISFLEFSVENFKIFKEKVTFSMIARKSGHTFEESGENILKTSLIYGPNASGKTSLLEAVLALRNRIVYNISQDPLMEKNLEVLGCAYTPFLLTDQSSNQDKNPIFLEAIFSIDNKIFRYNFSFLDTKIITENLSEIISSKEEKYYFKRVRQEIKVYFDFKKSKDVFDTKTRDDALFLKAASEWNNSLAMKIVGGFKDINIIKGTNSGYRGYTMGFIQDTVNKNMILDYLKKADFCIDDIILDNGRVSFVHNRFDLNGKKNGTIKFGFENESIGTQKFFDILGPIFDTLANGRVLFIDEFDNSLHPFLTKLIIDLFEKNNSKNAQLVVTTHDTSLLSYKDLYREQFWFTEKNKFGSAKFFSLLEFKSIRNEMEFSKKYLEGRFGAVPFIDL
ncbi:MAG: AAA family ATPase [Candidatus Pacebacteria bacterium]|nr:AAA family ATPase [Candidatus Paceibacterota bacterium]